MHNAVAYTRTVVLLAFLLPGSPVFSQGGEDQELRIMFYNTENFFDTADDTLAGDDEFLPGGRMNWTIERYNSKLNSVFKMISAAGTGRPPALVGMCEIENFTVIDDLLKRTFLSKHRYKAIHRDSPDERGIDVCLIYDSDIFSALSYSFLVPPGTPDNPFRSRSVLFAEMKSGRDTLFVFVNHWPSRRRGVLDGQDMREVLAGIIRGKCDSLAGSRGPGAAILIMGDFNCPPDENPLASGITGGTGEAGLVNLSDSLSAKGKGSYRYRGVWEMLDQIIVSRSLLGEGQGFRTSVDSFSVFSPSFLLGRDRVYPGLSPWSTYSGYTYTGGFSDHLPVVISLHHHLKDPPE